MKWIAIVFMLFALNINAKTREMHVLTFNTWLLEDPFLGIDLAKDIDERLNRMPEALANSGADVIFLQEVWKKKFRQFLIKKMHKLGYHACYKDTSRLFSMGNGLLTFSRFPFYNKCQVRTFSVRTRSDERFVKKGVISGTVVHPDLGQVKLYNTHLGAASFIAGEGFDREHTERQLKQKEQLVSYVQETHSDLPYIMAADLNVHDHHYDVQSGEYDVRQYNRGYEFIMNELQVVDTYRQVFTDVDHSSYPGITFGTKNPYVGSGTNSGFLSNERLDYIFTSDTNHFETTGSDIVLNDKRSGFFLSDHFGLLSKLKY